MPNKANKKAATQACPHGMTDIIDQSFFEYQGFYEKAASIALYYGFRPIQLPAVENELLYTNVLPKGTDRIDKELYALKTKGGEHLILHPDGRFGCVRAYIEHEMNENPQPVMLFYYGPFHRHTQTPDKHNSCEFRQFGIEILGTRKSVADAQVIKILMTILEEAGIPDLSVEINSMGDNESKPAFMRELNAHIRKNVNKMSATTRQRIKTNPLSLYVSTEDKDQVIIDEAPDPVSFLTGSAKQHLREILEYMDALNLTYSINPRFVKEDGFYQNTIFRIVRNTTKTDDEGNETIEQTPFASGGRFDPLAKMMGYKKEIPGVGGAIGVDTVLHTPGHKKFDPRILKKPKVFFIQLGFEAKLKSMEVIELLREAKIPVQLSLSKDKLQGQLSVAEKLKIPYSIILGQREAMDNTVIVRSMKTRGQHTVPLDKLVAHIKASIK